MAKKNIPTIDAESKYTLQEAEPLLELKSETLKKKCRAREIKGIQVGTKKKWHILGAEILRLRKLWNLD